MFEQEFCDKIHSLVGYIQGWKNNGYTASYRADMRRAAESVAANLRDVARANGYTIPMVEQWTEEHLLFHHTEPDWAGMVRMGIWSGGLRFV